MEQYSVFCEICNSHISAEQYETHKMGKRHKIEEEKLARVKNLQETGLYIRGMPIGTSAGEVAATFGQFGCIAKVEVYGGTAYVNYMDSNSCEEALKHPHVIRDQPLTVTRRMIRSQEPVPSSSQNKRSFDSTKNQPKAQKAATQKVGKAAPGKPPIDNTEILTALADPLPISEQMTTLKRLILVGEENGNQILQFICNDVVNVLKSAFSTCDLFSFGSMTTGLAFKDSDLDVFAHLEFNQSTHLLPKASIGNKIFVKAKSCFFRRSDLFNDIVPIQRAKIPIIKIVHVKTQVACDVSFRDAIGYYNSNLLRHYLNMNEKFFDLMVFIKYWARVHGFCTPNRLSNFSLCMLGLSFFLSLKDADGKKIVPPVQDLIKNSGSSSCLHVQDWNCGFDNTPITVTLPESSDFSLLGLLKSFFEYIAQLPFNTHVVSVLTGELISKTVFEEHPGDLPDVYECYKSHISKHPEAVLCKRSQCAVIHDPFKLNHNLLERVNLPTMQAFIQACKDTAENCAVAMNNDEMQLSLFHQLLKVVPLSGKVGNPHVAAEATPVVTAKEKPVFVGMTNNPFVASENPLADVKEFICCMFEKLMLLEITTPQEKDASDENDSNMKVARADCMQNVHDDNCFEIICEGQKCVWVRRKFFRQVLKIKKVPTFKEEEMISQHIKEQPDTDGHIRFRCEVSLKNEGVVLKFENLLPTFRGRFNAFTTFIKVNMNKWNLNFAADLKKSYLHVE